MSDKLDKVKEKIRRLAEMTEENGCTKAEALTATTKMGKLLDEHQLSMSDVELRKQDCKETNIWTGTSQRDHMSALLGSIAFYSDTKPWMVSSRAEGLKYVYFGLSSDVELAKYTHCVINRAILEADEEFKKTPKYLMIRTPAYKRKASRSFKMCMAMAISEQLRLIKKERQAWTKSQGRDLVVVKDAIVKQSFQQLGINLRSVSGLSPAGGQGYGDGITAGKNFNLNEGLKGAASKGALEK